MSENISFTMNWDKFKSKDSKLEKPPLSVSFLQHMQFVLLSRFAPFYEPRRIFYQRITRALSTEFLLQGIETN